MNTLNDSNPIQQWFALSLRDENSPRKKKIYSSTNERIDLFSITEKITKSLSTSNPSKNEAVSICQTIFKEIEEYSSEKFDIPVKWAARYTRHGESTKNAYVGAYEIFHGLFQKIEERKDLYDTNDPHVRNALSKMKKIDREILKCVKESLPVSQEKKGKRWILNYIPYMLIHLDESLELDLLNQGLANVVSLVRHEIFSKLDLNALVALSKTSQEVRNQIGAELVYLFNQGIKTPQDIGIKNLKELHELLGEWMKQVQCLTCKNCSIEGFDWKLCPELNELNLFGSNPNDLSFLESLKKLQKLNLHGCRLEDFTPIQHCTLLTNLDLSQSNAKDLSFLKSLEKLQKLDLHECKLKDFTPIQYCTLITDLNLCGSKVKDLSFLKSLGKLQKLNLYGCRLEDFTPIQHCTLLTDLNLCESNVMDLSFLTTIGENLKKLDLSLCKIKDFSLLVNCNKLEDLTLPSRVEDISFLETIGENLKKLNLSGCKLKNSIPIQQCTLLTDLNLNSAHIKDLSFLKSLPNLQMLDLSSSTIQNQDLTLIESCTPLKELKMTDLKISDLTFLKALRNLQKLDLSSSEIQDPGPIAYCINVENLNLSFSKVDNLSFLKALGENLQILDLQNCKGLDFENSEEFLDFSPIQYCLRLKHLELKYTNVNDLGFLEEIGPNLEYLCLYECPKIKDYTPIRRCTQLKNEKIF